MTVNINAANISSVQLAAAQTPSAPNSGFVRLHHNANSRLAMRPATGNVVEFLGNTSGSGAGITFPNSQAASSDVNTLDDYEEGSWSPTYTTSGTNFTSVTYTANRVGRYTKIGQLVTATFAIETSGITVGSATGIVMLGGLPFATANITAFHQTGSIGANLAFAGNFPTAIIANINDTRAFLYYRTAVNGATNTMAIADLGTGAASNLLYGVITYIV